MHGGSAKSSIFLSSLSGLDYCDARVRRGLGFWVCALRCACTATPGVKSDVLEVCALRGARCAVEGWIEDGESFPKHPGSPSNSSNSASYGQNGAKVAYATHAGGAGAAKCSSVRSSCSKYGKEIALSYAHFASEFLSEFRMGVCARTRVIWLQLRFGNDRSFCSLDGLNLGMKLCQALYKPLL